MVGATCKWKLLLLYRVATRHLVKCDIDSNDDLVS